MKLKDYTKEDLEAMSYDEIAILLLQESGKKMKLQTLFSKICKLLDYDENEFADHITDFFELLSTNKKFVMLSNGYWDLQTKHNSEIIIEDNEDDTFETDEEVKLEDEETDQEPENVYYDEENPDDDVEDDDLSDLVVIDEDEEAGL